MVLTKTGISDPLDAVVKCIAGLDSVSRPATGIVEDIQLDTILSIWCQPEGAHGAIVVLPMLDRDELVWIYRLRKAPIGSAG
jgi:hypothetical protein